MTTSLWRLRQRLWGVANLNNKKEETLMTEALAQAELQRDETGQEI